MSHHTFDFNKFNSMQSVYFPTAPTAPVVGILAWNETWIRVSWEPSRKGNPGSVFYTQYRPRSWYIWSNTADEYLENTADLVALSPGTTYQIRAVAKNGEGNEAASEWQEVTTSGLGEQKHAMMCFSCCI